MGDEERQNKLRTVEEAGEEKIRSREQRPEDVATHRKRHSSKKRLIWLISGAMIVVLGALAVLWWFVFKPVEAPSTNVVAVNTPNSKNPEPQVDEKVDPILQRFISPSTGEKWLVAPKKLGDQGFFQPALNPGEAATYYEVGSRGGSLIILGLHMFGLGPQPLLFEKAPNGSIAAILRPDSFAVYRDEDLKWSKEILAPGVVADTTTRYDSLSMPESIELDKGVVVKKPQYPTLGRSVIEEGKPEGVMRSTIKKLGASTLWRDERSYVDTKLTTISYTMGTPIGTEFTLEYQPMPMRDFRWSEGSYGSESPYAPIARGCGGLVSSVTRSDVLTGDDLKVIGKASNGQTVYAIKDANHSLWIKAFEEFKTYLQSDPSNVWVKITKEEFVNEHAVIVFKDTAGQYLVYVRQDLAPSYGCAKPVVYLYPTKDTQVNVKIGADVKISDPLYSPRTGWNAFARPNGQLSVDGKHYDSLFWEGPGIGEYPAITSGTIVKRQQAIATIRIQLAAQGFNQKESDDFVEYWQDKLPNKPYIRLTWLTTDQLNRLAPLTITPRPQTVIRTFLDFAGYDYPIKLPQQTFTKVERRGFTVTEWGGLSPYKLY